MTLSDKSVTYQQVLGIHYLEEDVKAFIKRIKENIRSINIHQMIDQEAGDKLIKTSTNEGKWNI